MVLVPVSDLHHGRHSPKVFLFLVHGNSSRLHVRRLYTSMFVCAAQFPDTVPDAEHDCALRQLKESASMASVRGH